MINSRQVEQTKYAEGKQNRNIFAMQDYGTGKKGHLEEKKR